MTPTAIDPACPRDFLPMTKAELAASYVELIGYDPFVDDPTITVEEVRETLIGYVLERAAIERQGDKS